VLMKVECEHLQSYRCNNSYDSIQDDTYITEIEPLGTPMTSL
jgi:hypothetical protein